MNGEGLARLFHDTYEAMAPFLDYKTRTETRVFDVNSSNGKLMIAVCDTVLKAVATECEE